MHVLALVTEGLGSRGVLEENHARKDIVTDSILSLIESVIKAHYKVHFNTPHQAQLSTTSAHYPLQCKPGRSERSTCNPKIPEHPSTSPLVCLS